MSFSITNSDVITNTIGSRSSPIVIGVLKSKLFILASACWGFSVGGNKPFSINSLVCMESSKWQGFQLLDWKPRNILKHALGKAAACGSRAILEYVTRITSHLVPQFSSPFLGPICQIDGSWKHELVFSRLGWCLVNTNECSL